MPFTEHVCQLHLTFLHQAAGLVPTDEEFVGWVDSHSVALRPALYLVGPQRCWAAGKASYQAWILESRGISISAYMAQQLSEKDYLRWVERFATPTLAPDSPKYDITG